MRRSWTAAAAALIAAGYGLPAEAGQGMPAPGMPALGAPAAQWPLVLPSPADIARPPSADPWVAVDPDRAGGGGCAPAWPCRLQLFGVIQKNGGVGLKGVVLTW
jgi:hypothetical protein